jgi:hypothetical protein
VTVPGLAVLKQGADPLLTWLPAPVHSAVWAILVNLLLYVVLRHAVPWLSAELAGPTDRVVEIGGVLLLLPEYALTTLMRRSERRLPGVVFGYGDLVQGVACACQWLLRTSFAALTKLKTGPWWVTMTLLLTLVVMWDGSYCVGKGAGCVIPTSQWARSVPSTWADPKPIPSPSPTPCPRKKHGVKAAKGCAPRHT